jgi:transmembrane sensor
MQVQRKIDELIALRASEWLEMLPSATEAERAEFTQWLEESRLHVQAFLEVAEIEFQLRRIDPERRQAIDLLLQDVAPNIVRLGPMPTPRVPRNVRWWRLNLAHAAGVLTTLVAVATIGAFFYARAPQFSTSIGEQRTVELPDSSVVTLNASSQIEVKLQDTERDVELRKGEAIFFVSHDPQRPFRVHTRAGTVEAVGTRFNVYDRPNGDTRVSVLEGRVRVTAKSSDAAAELLGVGEEADIRFGGTIQRNTKAVVANTVAWRQRRLVFENTPLEDMIAEFNRYNRAPRLRLIDVQPNAYRYDGIFDAADPQSLVSVLSREPELIVEERADEVIVRPRVQ